MKPIYMFLIINLLAISSVSSSVVVQQPLFLSCGISKSTNVKSLVDNRVWKSDDDPNFAPPNINTISTTATNTSQQGRPPYDTARLFGSPLTYTFSLPPGPKFLRFYFTILTSYNNIPYSDFFISLKANQHILLNNFSTFLNSPDANIQNVIMKEFHLTVENHLNLTFSPGDRGNGHNNLYGFINAIEIVPIPQGLYVNLTQTAPPLKDLSNPDLGYAPQNTTALQTLYRLNVGGHIVSPYEDSGSMWRTWYEDQKYLVPGGLKGGQEGGLLYGSDAGVKYTLIPPYVAPKVVYGTERIMGAYLIEMKLSNNLSWSFEVDPGFNYLVRLHFCEMDLNITRSNMRKFNVYINNLMADKGVDVWALTRGTGVATFKDYVIKVGDGGDGSGTKLPLRLDLHPWKLDTGYIDVLLNGLEMMKLSELDGQGGSNLAAPNPPQVPPVPSPPTTLLRKGSNHRSLLIIGGAIGGTLFISLFLITWLIVYKRRANKEKNIMDTNTASKDKWAPISFDLGSATTSTMSSSLPSDLCRHFTFIQIRVATRDFDENLVIGRGGFGKVYKGSIDGGATKVAIKRLNSTSKQGVREFQTEIEMLSRLRHVHLVPLIGYCEDEGEMILVYEYMPRGTLRDHLFYKTPQKIDNTNNNPLSWKQRLMICVGSARGLHYLHAGAKQLIIHRDVKSTNILLDDKWTAKVSDFGLSKVGPDQIEAGATYVSTAVKGSAGYLDPEYFQRHQLTEKSDVYSFGVVLFEVLCARAAVNPNLPKEQANLAIWAQSHYKKGTLHTIVDPNLTGQIAPESLRKFGEIATMCVRDRGIERPSMGDIVWGLEFALQLQETAEDNKIANGTPNESFDLSSSYLNAIDVGFTDNDISTNSGDNFSQSSVVEGTSKKFMDSNSKSTTSSSSDYLAHSKPGSVFSEITHPTAR